MKNKIFKLLKILLPLSLGVFLIYYSYHQFTDDQRNDIYTYIKMADYRWVLLSMLIALASHLSRAWRWNYMLDGLGKTPKLITNIMAIGVGYAMNIFIPRSGEISRAAIVNRHSGIAFDKAIGTIIAERVLDLIILLIISVTAISMAGDEIIQFFWGLLSDAFAKADTQQLLIYGVVALVILSILIILLRYLNLMGKIKGFLRGIQDGFFTIWTMQQKWAYLGHTLFIWGMYVLMFYISTFALPGTSSIAIPAILCAFVAGSFAVAFTNGGFGAYPLFIAAVLLFFNVPETLGTSFGWILWISQTLLVLVYGLLSFVLLSFQQTTRHR
ncbi:lysylphosphatidylglycerol synthase transmembrane domain-containing protein [Nonlabens xiamenensis]|uniref:lysylphosphatidylglycerol synthase transmembrane domain-containing protein n=1 Tax=Nonlabens xiamenensis TaxID=2341043 RepID=UPI001F0CA8E8|nr:lysylphosphatidylglycerol synthase transmembrane domain-containing protein [Nonlabens xiamenensis]